MTFFLGLVCALASFAVVAKTFPEHATDSVKGASLIFYSTLQITALGCAYWLGSL